jgi:Predicted dehydrogenases and related proteins
MKMNKAVIIGNSGHYSYALDSIKQHGIEIAAVSCLHDENPDRLKKHLTDIGHNPEVFDNYIDMLDTVKPDIAVINTLFHLNTNCAIECLKRDVNVFLEKPAALTLGKLNELKAVYNENSHLKLAGMFGIRYDANFQTIKQRISEIGNIRMITSQKSYKMGNRPEFYRHRETYGGIIPWVAIHGIDWMTWLTGEKYLSVNALHSNDFNRNHGDMEVTSAALYEMTGGIIAAFNADMLRPDSAPTHGDDRVRIVGTDGVLESINGRVTLNGSEIPLAPAIDIFDVFLNGSAELNAIDLFESTYAALLTRESADKKTLLKF